MDPIKESIRTYIAKNILFSKDGYPYKDETSLLEEGIIDSMNVLELVAFIEEKFQVTVNDREIIPDNFDSVSKLAAYVQSKVTVPVSNK